MSPARLPVLFFLFFQIFQLHAQDGYTLSGIAPASLEGVTIYLSTIDYSGSKANIKDSTRIEHGRFKFTGKIPHKAMLTNLGMLKPRFGLYLFLLHGKRGLYEPRILSGANRPTTIRPSILMMARR